MPRTVMKYPPLELSVESVRTWRETEVILRSIPHDWAMRGGLPALHADLRGGRFFETLPSDELLQYMNGDERDWNVLNSRPDSSAAVRYLLEATLESGLTKAIVEEVSGIVTGYTGNKIGTGSNRSKSDAFGRVHHFLGAQWAHAALDEVLRVWNLPADRTGEFPIYLWTFVAIINTHPFIDGNGRLAHALAASRLIKESTVGFVFPFAPYVYASREKFILAERRASIEGNWSSLIALFHAFALHLQSFVLQRTPALTDDVHI